MAPDLAEDVLWVCVTFCGAEEGPDFTVLVRTAGFTNALDCFVG